MEAISGKSLALLLFSLSQKDEDKEICKLYSKFDVEKSFCWTKAVSGKSLAVLLFSLSEKDEDKWICKLYSKVLVEKSTCSSICACVNAYHEIQIETFLVLPKREYPTYGLQCSTYVSIFIAMLILNVSFSLYGNFGSPKKTLFTVIFWWNLIYWIKLITS